MFTQLLITGKFAYEKPISQWDNATTADRKPQLKSKMPEEDSN